MRNLIILLSVLVLASCNFGPSEDQQSSYDWQLRLLEENKEDLFSVMNEYVEFSESEDFLKVREGMTFDYSEKFHRCNELSESIQSKLNICAEYHNYKKEFDDLIDQLQNMNNLFSDKVHGIRNEMSILKSLVSEKERWVKDLEGRRNFIEKCKYGALTKIRDADLSTSQGIKEKQRWENVKAECLLFEHHYNKGVEYLNEENLGAFYKRLIMCKNQEENVLKLIQNKNN